MKKIIFYSTLVMLTFFQVACKKEKLESDDYTPPPPAVNIIPTANAGTDQTIIAPQVPVTVYLQGSGTDTDGTIESYLWRWVGGNSEFTVLMDSAQSASTSVSGLSYGVFLFELQVRDNVGAIGRDTVMVIIESVQPEPGPDTLIISEWFSGSLIEDRGEPDDYYEGYYKFDTPLEYDSRTHRGISFAKISGTGDPLYQSSLLITLPGTRAGTLYEFVFEFAPDEFGFTLYGLMMSSAPAGLFHTALAMAKSYEYRFIIVSKILYENLSINWGNYLEVSRALQFTP